MSGDRKDYPVGYGRPPKQTQFQKGQSGNPKGRPKGSPNLATLLEQELDRKIPVTEQGEQRMLSKRQVLIRQLVNKALGGEPRSIHTLLQFEMKTVQADTTPVMSEEDVAELARYRAEAEESRMRVASMTLEELKTISAIYDQARIRREEKCGGAGDTGSRLPGMDPLDPTTSMGDHTGPGTGE